MIGAVAIGALLFVLQHVLFVDFTVFGIHPELLLLYAVSCGLANGTNFGLVAGFIAGLAADAFMTSSLGLSAFAYALAGYTAGILSDDTTSEPLPTAMSAAAASALGVFVVLVAGSVTGELHIDFGHALAILFIAPLINGVLALPVVRSLRSLKRERDVAW